LFAPSSATAAGHTSADEMAAPPRETSAALAARIRKKALALDALSTCDFIVRINMTVHKERRSHP
jgi:hypothetical protein